MRLVLASGSPRRKELLTQAGFAFEVRVAGIDEIRRVGEAPVEYVKRLAVEKARGVLAALASSPTSQNRDVGPPEFSSSDEFIVVIGADTTVALEGEVMEKPLDREDAARMLRALSGRTHQVHTGVAVVCRECLISHVETTDVVFREIGDAELAAYLNTGDSLDKAGAYGVQGYAARWIPRIEGDYFNVMGLPISAVVGMLGRCRGMR